MHRVFRLSIAAIVMIASAAPALAGRFGQELYIPAAGRVSGTGGSEFYTTLWITNPHDEEVIVTVEFIPTGENPGNRPDFQRTLPRDSTTKFENVTQQHMNAAGSLGSLRIQSNRPVLASARVYNQFPGQTLKDSTGVFFNALPRDSGLSSNQRAILQGVRQDSEFRYNIFMQEVSGQPASVILQVRDGLGLVQGTKTFELNGFEHRFLNVGEIAPMIHSETAVIHITVQPTKPGRVIVVGSLTANASQDPTGFEPSEPF